MGKRVAFVLGVACLTVYFTFFMARGFPVWTILLAGVGGGLLGYGATGFNRD